MAYSINAESRKRLIVGVAASLSAVALAGMVLAISPRAAPVVTMALPVTLIFAGLRGLVNDARASKWPSVEATVLGVSEDWIDVIMHYNALRHFYPRVRYRYTFQGVEYVSDRVSFQVEDIWVPEYDQWGIKTDGAAKLWRNWKEGGKIAAYVNPKNPAESLLVPRAARRNKSQQIALVVGGVLIGVVWFCLNCI
jgi:hypothetical protein